METEGEVKLQQFLLWLQANGVELRGCEIRPCDSNKGFGVFSTKNGGEGVLLTVPLDLAITPMRVLLDPTIGPKCREMVDQGDVDDRFLINLFLTIERIRKHSLWKPYLDMLPTAFGNPLWFTNDELWELKGTTLYNATILQKRKLQALYDDKVSHLIAELVGDEELERDVNFEDFLWANSVFWSRALNIPFPHSRVFPQSINDREQLLCHLNKDNGASITVPKHYVNCEMIGSSEETSASSETETVWVEGLVPGIDFCNHDLKATANWEVDQTGLITGVPFSMYLLSVEEKLLLDGNEIFINYGNKGNEELLYLYGFVMKDNPDDYLMLHYPIQAIQMDPFCDTKLQLLEIQKAETRSLLQRQFLDCGFFTKMPQSHSNENEFSVSSCNFSWSGQRKVPHYLTKLVFPEAFLVTLRTVAMKENELHKVTSLLEELVGLHEERQPSDLEVTTAIWEVCGDFGAVELLIDLLTAKMIELEEGTGTQAGDMELLQRFYLGESTLENPSEIKDRLSESKDCPCENQLMSKNRYSSIVYRLGQKQLTRQFLSEAEHVMQLLLEQQ